MAAYFTVALFDAMPAYDLVSGTLWIITLEQLMLAMRFIKTPSVGLLITIISPGWWAGAFVVDKRQSHQTHGCNLSHVWSISLITFCFYG